MLKLSEKELKSIDKFNSSIKMLCLIVKKFDQNNLTVERIGKQLALIIDCNPLVPITAVSPYFLKYQKEILQRNESFFLSGPNELADASKEIIEIFNLISNKWSSLKQNEINIIWEKINIMNTSINDCIQIIK